jgi:hypothetical protein
MEMAKENKKPRHRLTTFEIELMMNLLNARSPNGGSIKDLRMIDSTQKLLKGLLPPKPARPELPALKPGEKHEEKAISEFQTQQQEWGNKMEAYLNEEVDCDFNDLTVILLKQKLQNFSQFNTDEGTRERVLRLAEKFGV